MLTIATGKEVALLLFHTPTKYGSDRFRQIFIDHWETLVGLSPDGRNTGRPTGLRAENGGKDDGLP